ncbi:MAG: hypothetical protein L6R37_000522 [Teloschistes peruensis]|nr:MAG: hypothetical protein L6R37_000522 [Teloschistes peruensis]
MATETEQQWPPRSPYAALLSSPSGRSRVRRYQDRTSSSPSPLKKARITPRRNETNQKTLAHPSPSEDEDDEDDEDEETLQLRLQALEAKLKLKQLKQKKTKKTLNHSDVENEPPDKVPASSKPLEQDRVKLGPPSQPSAIGSLQIPVSPQRKFVANEKPKSPGRVLLGIDKGLKGKNVSLRRVPETKSHRRVSEDPFLEEALSSVQKADLFSSASSQQDSSLKPKKSFSERINESRKRDKEQAEKAKRVQSQRSTGFGIGKEAIEAMKAATEEEAKARGVSSKQTTTQPAFTRDQILKAARKPDKGLGHRDESNVKPRRKEFKNPNASPEFTKPTKPPPKPRSPSPTPAPNSSATSKNATPTDDSLFEPFSSLHLSKRLIPHGSLTKALTGKSILLLPDLLSTVKAPDYSLPDSIEADFVLLATIASKSTPLAHKDCHKTDTKAPLRPSTSDAPPSSSLAEAAESESNVKGGKYMALTLTDLKWTLDLYLFGTAYTRWWKLTPGTLIAILNPSIMPPPPHNPHNNRFSLTLHSNDDTILEIGTARDLSWCSSLRRDGKGCGAWIDKRHTSVCECHVDQVLEKTRRGRMEVNGMSAPFAPGGRKGGRSGFWGGGGSDRGTRSKSRAVGPGGIEGGVKKGGGSRLSDGSRWDRTHKSAFFVGGPTRGSGSGIGSAAALLDATGDDVVDRAGREERVRKRMAEREREREIARRLGERGDGIGREYLGISSQQNMADGGAKDLGGMEVGQGGRGSQQEEGWDARKLGLLGNRAGDALLSPIKKKRRVGGVLEGVEAGVGGKRKKTRFLTEKGVREAGRESLSVAGEGMVAAQGEEEDELDIV